MRESSTYTVAINGDIKPGVDLLEVQHAFAKLFSITPEQASSFVGKQQILKKDIDIKTAHAYKTKLEAIGLVVELKEKLQEPEKPTALSLQPIDEDTTTDHQSETITDPDTLICPKCGLKQPKATQCTGCGVFFDKYQKQKIDDTNTVNNADEASRNRQNQQSTVVITTSAFNIRALLAGSVAAFLGALLWKLIAVKFNFELGIIAWFIGGAVGFSAAMFGSKGQTAGIVCGILTLLAILGGKYLAMDSFQSELVTSLSSSNALYSEEMQELYDQEVIAAKAFANESLDEDSLRQFMLDYEYTDSLQVDDISLEEISYFKDNIQPRLEMIELSSPGFEQWIEDGFQAQIKNMSTIELIKEDFDFIDIIFLILGIGTAFRLGRGMEA